MCLEIKSDNSDYGFIGTEGATLVGYKDIKIKNGVLKSTIMGYTYNLHQSKIGIHLGANKYTQGIETMYWVYKNGSMQNEKMLSCIDGLGIHVYLFDVHSCHPYYDDKRQYNDGASHWKCIPVLVSKVQLIGTREAIAEEVIIPNPTYLSKITNSYPCMDEYKVIWDDIKTLVIT